MQVKENSNLGSNAQVEENSNLRPLYSSRLDERSVGQDKEPMIAISKLLKITPNPINWCQNVGDNPNCRSIIPKRLNIVVEFLYPGTLNGNSIGQNKGPLVAFFNTLNVIPDFKNQHQNLGTMYKASERNKSYYAQPSAVEAHPNIVAQITKEINSLINQHQDAPTKLQQLLETTFNQAS